MSTDYERVRDAILYIEAHASEQPELDDVARHIGLSPAHLQRTFRKWAGISPKRFLQALTASRAKELLRESRPVLDTAFEVGLSGSGRLHDLMIATEAMTPGEYKRGGAGLQIRYGEHETPFGRCLLGATDRGIVGIRFFDKDHETSTIAEFTAEWPNADLERDDCGTASLARQVFESGIADGGGGAGADTDSREPKVNLLLRGTNFQIKVWEALVRVPEGTLIAYSELASRMGIPSSTRAVASAVGANPIAYLIPCHRVLRASGELGGYRWGADRKAVMLERELA